MLDRWQEILDTLWRHKLRTFLTALSVAWGIFMLVILLGAGSGLQNSFIYKFRDDALNSVFVRPGKTSVAHAGYKVGRQVQFDDDDFDAVKTDIPDAENVSGRVFLWGESTVRYGEKYSVFNTMAVHPGHLVVEKTIMTKGRFINDIDIRQQRKVAVVGVKVVEHLFDDIEADPVGERINIGGIQYLVVGAFRDEGGEREESTIFLPLTTAQTAYGRGRQQDQLLFTLRDATDAKAQATKELTQRLMAQRKNFSTEDERALRIMMPIERMRRVQGVFAGINLFVWIVGIGTIIAGIVGVSNIMMISVRERTKEFGVRKALGATPWSIIGLVVQEALLLTGVAGYAGLLAGVGLLELVNKFALNESTNDYIMNPTVDIEIAITATVLLVVAGVLAGFFPARRAARVNPVVALRDE